jgi:hypothetical protein
LGAAFVENAPTTFQDVSNLFRGEPHVPEDPFRVQTGVQDGLTLPVTVLGHIVV